MVDNGKVTNLRPEDAEEIMISKIRENIVERSIFKIEN